MKITIVTGIFSKEQTYFFDDMVKAFASFGAEVTVIAGYPNRNESDERRNYYISHPVMSLYDHVCVHWVGPKHREGKNLFSRMLRYLHLTVSLYREAVKTETDAYYIYSTPPFLGYIGCLLARKHAPTLYDAQDLFPDSLVHVKGYGENSPLIRFLRLMEKKVYRGNTHINVISNDMMKTIVRNGCPPEKAGVIFYGSNTAEISHISREENRLFDEFDIDRNKFIIAYGGAIRYLQRWPVTLRAAKILSKRIPQIEFVIFGDGACSDDLKRRVAAEGITNIRLFPMLPSHRMAELYSLGDLELVPLERGVTQFALPSKLWMIMAAESPILALLDENSEIADIIRKKEIGYVVDTEDGNLFAEQIGLIYKRKEELLQMGKRAREYVVKEHDLLSQYKLYYDELVRISSKNLS